MLNNIGLPGLLLIAIVVLVLFGRGKISSLMGEVGKGITAFKKGVGEGSKDDEEVQTSKRVEEIPSPAVHGSDAASPASNTAERERVESNKS